MKKQLMIAMTAATCAAAAHAQSSVTLYGAIDGGLLYQSTAAASFSPAAKNQGAIWRYKDAGIYSSIWGMQGVEDIGAGYKVTFKLQGVFDSGTGKLGLSDTAGVPGFFNQIASVGVSGTFGSITAGRQIVPMIYAMADTDVRASQYFGSILGAWLGLNTAAGWPGTSTNGPIGALYDSNALVYRSPAFHGVTAELEYAPGGVAGQLQGNTRESAVLKYSGYGLKLAAVYYNGHDTNPGANSVPTGLNNNRYWYFGALYTVHDFSISGSYSNGSNPAHRNMVNLDLYSLGLGYRFTPAFRITSGAYYITDKNHSANNSLEVAAGAEYSLSKQTLVYAQVGWVNNHGEMTQTITYGQPVAPGNGTTAVMMGMRHNF
ncbi:MULTISPECIES: porin [unclassified Paraburkholderia]|uniref:porin n=1 Tax=unclassified Paraburkholderia TaxID=2615204 RepID=UPI002AB7D933|nr:MULTISPECIES: porin [unclassified Paraburkholderia]